MVDKKLYKTKLGKWFFQTLGTFDIDPNEKDTKKNAKVVKKAVECAFPSKNFDPVEIIKCVVNSPEVLKYVTKIIALVKEGKLDEIQAVIIEALPAVVYKAFECAFPENSPRPNFHREHKLHRPHFPHFPRKPRPFTRIGNPCGEGFHACGCNSAKMNEDKRAHNRVAKYCCCEDTE